VPDLLDDHVLSDPLDGHEVVGLDFYGLSAEGNPQARILARPDQCFRRPGNPVKTCPMRSARDAFRRAAALLTRPDAACSLRPRREEIDREAFVNHAPLWRGSTLALALLACPLAAPAQAAGQGIAIEHEAIGCVVAGKFSVVDACFAPGTELARARVYFRPEGTPSWYYVDNWGHRMPRAQATCLQTTLPKAKKSLVNKHVEYYLEAVGKSMGESQSAHYSPLVVTSEGECKDKKPAAVLPGAIGNVLPAVPAGFAVGAGISAGTVAAVVGAGVVGAG